MKNQDQILMGAGDTLDTLGHGGHDTDSTKEVPRPPWLDWCERNSQPRKLNITRPPRRLTRWQKRGPMTKKDWKRFLSWAARRAMPLEHRPVPPPKIACAARYLPCAKKKKKMDYDEFMEKMEALSKPRTITEKYEKLSYAPTYSPAIVWGERPHRDPGRPFDPPHVPCCFPNMEIEGDFWAQLRFPVRPAALMAHSSPRIISLAKPRQWPPTPHCAPYVRELKPLEVPPPKRKKFTPRGWKLHQIRLMYLSKPVTRNEYDFYFYM